MFSFSKHSQTIDSFTVFVPIDTATILSGHCGCPTFLTPVVIVSFFILTSLPYTVLICIFLMINEAKHCFLCLLAISVTSALKRFPECSLTDTPNYEGRHLRSR